MTVGQQLRQAFRQDYGWHLSVAALLVASVLGASAVQAKPGVVRPAVPVTECDRLTGAPPDRVHTTYDEPVVHYRQGKTAAEMDAVILACRDAAERYPADARFPFRLGLVLRDRGLTAEAMQAFATARNLGSLGGYDEAAMLLFFGSRADSDFAVKDGKAGLALIDEGIAKTKAPVLMVAKALGLLRGPQDIRDEAAGYAVLRELARKNDVLATVILADFLYDSKAEKNRKEAIALDRKAVTLGSGYAATALALWLKNDDPVTARKMAELGAKRGSAIGQQVLGMFYEFGTGGPADAAKARAFYEQAALAGNALAQRTLGKRYKFGGFVPVDYAKAVYWLDLAGKHGNAEAMVELGMMYDHAVGVVQDLAKARALYERAAALGNREAMNNMGYLFENGRAAQVDLAKAREWYEKAAAMGDGNAASNLGLMYQDGKGVPVDYKKALKYLEQSAAAGHANGTSNLAFSYWRGMGVTRDPVKARALFRKAVELGSNEAALNLGRMLEDGEGGPSNLEEAKELFKKSAEASESHAGKAHAMYRYAMRVYYTASGRNYRDGSISFNLITLANAYARAKREGREQDFIEARRWLAKAVEAGDDTGTALLAAMTADGLGGEKDAGEALRLFERAAGDPEVKINLAVRLRRGKGLEADPTRARRLFTELLTTDQYRYAVSELVNMLDRGEGGAREPEAATSLLQRGVDAGKKDAYRLLAERLIKGLGTAPDPAQARLLLAAAVAQDDWQAYGPLGLLFERGEGGAASVADALAFYQLGYARNDDLAASRLAVLLRDGRGIAADPARAREIFKKTTFITDPDAQMAYVAMLDKGEGGDRDPTEAADKIFEFAFIMHEPAAIALLRSPEGAVSEETRKALVARLQKADISVPATDGSTTALIDAETEAKLKAQR